MAASEPLPTVWEVSVTYESGLIRSTWVSALYEIGPAIMALTSDPSGYYGRIVKIEAE